MMETAIDPRQPSRLEKKANMVAVSYRCSKQARLFVVTQP